jgi:hypothetical protein
VAAAGRVAPLTTDGSPLGAGREDVDPDRLIEEELSPAHSRGNGLDICDKVSTIGIDRRTSRGIDGNDPLQLSLRTSEAVNLRQGRSNSTLTFGVSTSG